MSHAPNLSYSTEVPRGNNGKRASVASFPTDALGSGCTWPGGSSVWACGSLPLCLVQLPFWHRAEALHASSSKQVSGSWCWSLHGTGRGRGPTQLCPPAPLPLFSLPSRATGKALHHTHTGLTTDRTASGGANAHKGLCTLVSAVGKAPNSGPANTHFWTQSHQPETNRR